MNPFSTVACRATQALLTSLLGAGLMACGGGGGSSAAPAAVGSLTGTLGCTIPLGESTCTATLQWASTDATAPKVILGATTVATTAVGTNTAQLIGAGSNTVVLLDGSTPLATLNIQGACAAGSQIDGSVCAPLVVRYSEFKLVRLADQGGYIGTILPDGSVKPLTNHSGFTAAVTGALAPLAICAIWDTKLANGWPVISCQTPGTAGNLRRNFPVDPISGTVEPEYRAAMPAGAVFHDVGFGIFGDAPYAAFGASQIGMYIDVMEGTYFFTDNDSIRLRLTGDGFASNKVVATCSNNIDCFHYLAVFSN